MESSTGKVEIHTRDGKFYTSSKRFFDILKAGRAMKLIPGAGEAVTVRGYEAVFGRRDGVVACVEFEIMFMAGSEKLKALIKEAFQISPLQVIMQAVNMPKEGPVPRRDYGPNKGRYPQLKLVGSPRRA